MWCSSDTSANDGEMHVPDKIINKQKCQTDTKYARRICGKFNGNDNMF